LVTSGLGIQPALLFAQDTAGVGTLLNAIRDTALQRVWREAAAAGQLTTADVRFFFPANPVITPHKTLLVTQQQLQRQGVSIPARAVADVRWSLSRPITTYDGPFNIITITDDSLVGRIKNDSINLTIGYRLPGVSQSLGIQPNSSVRVHFSDRTSSLTRHTELWVTTNQGEPLLFQLRDGSPRPYEFDPGPRGPPLTIRQRLSPGLSGTPILDLKYGTQKLPPANVGDVRDVPGAGVRIFVLSNVYAPRGQDRAPDGDAYAVQLLLWRTKSSSVTP
jgi:hypothetical protein